MKIKVLVVDDNESLVNKISDYFKNSRSIQIIDELNDGIKAINAIKNKEFDVMLLDLVMPNKDGIAVLDYIKDNNLKINVIVISSCANDEIVTKVSEYGVKYFVVKPFNISDVEKKIIDLYETKQRKGRIIDLQDKDIQIRVTNLLHELGIPSHIKGYEYIRTAILMVYNNSEFIGGITRKLYPDISAKFNTTIQRVERAIRHAIEIAWLRGDIDLMEEIFGHSVDIDRAKPTNSEFIVTIADKLKIEKTM